jgi:Mrp family chromosome partitioning ATPase
MNGLPPDQHYVESLANLGEPLEPMTMLRGHDQRAPTFRRIINPADWEGVTVPPREWIVPDYIPHKTVTLLSGDGGTGKSLLAMQLAAARALARDWIGLLPEPSYARIWVTG